MGNSNSHQTPLLPGDDEDAIYQSIEDDLTTAAQHAHETAGPASPASGYRCGSRSPTKRSPSFRPSPSPNPPQPPPQESEDDEEPPALAAAEDLDLDSPDLLPPGQIPAVLAQAVPTYIRPRQPNRPRPAPGQRDLDNEDEEQQAWNAVFNAEGVEAVQQAVNDYLNVAGGHDFLARIADIHGQDELVVRRRFGRRYLDDAPWREGVDSPGNTENMALTLRRILMDEVDLPYMAPEEALRRWQDLSWPQRQPGVRSGRRATPEDIERYIARYGFDRWLRCFRSTHGDREEYRAGVDAFFYRDGVTGREETRDARDNVGPRALAKRVVAWMRSAGSPLRVGEGRARLSDRSPDVVGQRLTNAPLNEFSESDGDLSEQDSLQRVRDALSLNRDGEFRWGLLYVRVLRHVELFGAHTTLNTVLRYVPAHIRPFLSRRGADAVLRLGHMRTGEASLAAIIADWLTWTRNQRLPAELRGARREGAAAPTVPQADDDTVSRRSRDRLQRRFNRAVDDMNLQLANQQALLDSQQAELTEARDDAEMARIERDVLQEEVDEDGAAGGNGAPTADDGEGDGGPTGQSPQPGVEDSEDELSRPTTPPRPHGRSSKPASFDSDYDLTPGREPGSPTRRQQHASSRGDHPSTKRRRCASANDEVSLNTPPGRRRRVSVHVAIPVTAAPQPAHQAIEQPATGAGRVTRSQTKAGKGILRSGLR